MNITVEKYDFNEGFENHIRTSKYPAIYILANKTDVYIGETVDYIRRANEHRKDISKKKYRDMYLFHGDNISVTLHFESMLIRLMIADGKYKVNNGNNGLLWNEYYEKEKYERIFDGLWMKLVEFDLVKNKVPSDILNLNLYLFSPFVSLNKDQEKSLNSMINGIELNEGRPIVINGEPGTGKTILGIYALLYLRRKYPDKKIAFVIVDPMYTTLRKVFSCIPGLNRGDVIKPININEENEYDILICDEVHKFKRYKNLPNNRAFLDKLEKFKMDISHDELDWVFYGSRQQVIFYDKGQRVSPTGLHAPYVEERLMKMGQRKTELVSQLRVNGGGDYVKYINLILNYKRVKKKTFKNYDFKLFTSFPEMVEAIHQKDSTEGLARLCAGYAWKWVTKKDKSQDVFDIIIGDYQMRWNEDNKDWINSVNSINEMGSIHTVHGYDLNYAGVVIGPDLKYNVNTKSIEIDKDCFFDKKVYQRVGDEELAGYITRTYAVLLTRGIKGTYVFACDPDLRAYLAELINCDVMGDVSGFD